MKKLSRTFLITFEVEILRIISNFLSRLSLEIFIRSFCQRLSSNLYSVGFPCVWKCLFYNILAQPKNSGRNVAALIIFIAPRFFDLEVSCDTTLYISKLSTISEGHVRIVDRSFVIPSVEVFFN